MMRVTNTFPREILCIVCPNCCRLTVEKNADGLSVSGGQCKRGEDFAIAELTNPVRTLTTTVRTSFPDIPVLPVRTDREIPLEKIFDAMNAINEITVSRNLAVGDIVAENILGLGANIIATSGIAGEEYHG